MTRTAEHSIRGYVYQFVQYLRELLNADDDSTVTIEGVVEDIDLKTASGYKAIQCKYHESADKFTLGKIYKPILLMVEHFANNQHFQPPIEYQLFCHFPGQAGDRSLSSAEISAILATTDNALQKIAARIPTGYDIDAFLCRCKITFGPTLADCECAAIKLLADIGQFTKADAEAIFFPAAFQKIVDISTKSNANERSLMRKPFLDELRRIKHTTLTRWTRELSTKDKIFKRLKIEIGQSISINARRRFFLIESAGIDAFDETIVVFIKSYIEKYAFKFLHTYPPIFCFSNNVKNLENIKERLFDKGIRCNDGYINRSEFRREKLLEEVIAHRTGRLVQRSFQIRIAQQSQLESFDGLPLEDLFLINTKKPISISRDVKIFQIEISSLSQLAFVLNMEKSYD